MIDLPPYTREEIQRELDLLVEMGALEVVSEPVCMVSVPPHWRERLDPKLFEPPEKRYRRVRKP